MKVSFAIAVAMSGLAWAVSPTAADVSPAADSVNAAGYDAGGRRDPFVDLRRPVTGGAVTRCRCGGPSGFLIQEMSLRGIVRTRQGTTALLQGVDGKTYFATAGTRLFDGVILAVEPVAVVFRQDVTDPLSAPRIRDIRMNLHPESTDPALTSR